MNFWTINSTQPIRNKSILFLSFFFLCNGLAAQTLFSVGNTAVSKAEFKKAYLRNNDTSAGITAKSVAEYLDLYTTFKLKVRAAGDMHLDTLLSQQEEVIHFRRQLEEPYLRDQEMMEKLIREAGERGKLDLQLSHIFIPYRKEFITNPYAVPPATAEDSARAKRAIWEAYNRHKKGESFEKLAIEYSLDPKVQQNKGYLGWITVFSLPYVLETTAYNLPISSTSEPIQSSAGWHILAKHKFGDRPALGKLKAQQILIAVDPEGGPSAKAKAARLADSIYNAMMKGADFSAMAASFSDDASASSGGNMPLTGVGQFDPLFEEQVFGLQKDGDITRPFITTLGYHIVKRLEQIRYSNDDPDHSWKAAVENDARSQLAVKSFEESCIRTTGLKKRPFNEKELWRYTDSARSGGNYASAQLNNKTVVLEAPGYQATVADWLKFMENRDPQGSEAAYRKLFDNFTSVTALEQYRKNLHIYNPAFAAQLNEFMEGNMLFEIMERTVWGPSGTDTAALRKLYRANPGKYKWDSSADIISMTGVDSALTESARRTLATSASSWKLITVNSGGNIMADSSRVELKQLGQIPQDLKPGYTSPLVINPDDGSASCFHVLKIYPQPTPRSFDDARGQLIAEQQQILEKKWIDDLKRKYPVKVDEKILEQIIRELAR